MKPSTVALALPIEVMVPFSVTVEVAREDTLEVPSVGTVVEFGVNTKSGIASSETLFERMVLVGLPPTVLVLIV